MGRTLTPAVSLRYPAPVDSEQLATAADPNTAASSGVPLIDAEREVREVARTAAAGSAAACGVLYDRHFSTVYRYAFVRVRDRMEAEDVTSETFMRALRSLDRYEPRAPFAAWLFPLPARAPRPRPPPAAPRGAKRASARSRPPPGSTPSARRSRAARRARSAAR